MSAPARKLTIPTPSVIANPISAESTRRSRCASSSSGVVGQRQFAASRASSRTRGDRVRKLEPTWTGTVFFRIVIVPSSARRERVQLLARRRRAPGGDVVVVDAVVQQFRGLVDVDAVGVTLDQAEQRVAASGPSRSSRRTGSSTGCRCRGVARLRVDIDAEARDSRRRHGSASGIRSTRFSSVWLRRRPRRRAAQRGGGPGAGATAPIRARSRLALAPLGLAVRLRPRLNAPSSNALIQFSSRRKNRIDSGRKHALVGHQIAERHAGQRQQAPQPGRDVGRDRDVAERCLDRLRVGEQASISCRAARGRTWSSL